MIDVTTRWTGGMAFTGLCGNQAVTLDAKAPLGKGAGMTPKELVALGIAGCTAMDVIALMRKYKQPVEAFDVRVETEQTQGQHPAVFARVHATFQVRGAVEPAKLMEAVNLSQTKYCGVSAMIHKTAPIEYTVILNGEAIGQGRSEF